MKDQSKKDEWHLVNERIFHLQGTRPKINRKRRLPAIRPAIGPELNEEKQRNLVSTSRGDGHFQPKSKCTLGCSKELTIDNVSLVIARMRNKLPYLLTNCAPLPKKLSFKIIIIQLPSLHIECRS